ncbi:MAG: STAS domain-containing protein [Sulfitobacter sp.]
MTDTYCLPGKLDLSTVQTLMEDLSPLAQGDLTLDGSAVTHLGALGAQLLLAVSANVRAHHGQFAVLNLPGRALDQLAAMGLCPQILAEGST